MPTYKATSFPQVHRVRTFIRNTRPRPASYMDRSRRRGNLSQIKVAPAQFAADRSAQEHDRAVGADLDTRLLFRSGQRALVRVGVMVRVPSRAQVAGCSCFVRPADGCRQWRVV
jgi:hypothetical protein